MPFTRCNNSKSTGFTRGTGPFRPHHRPSHAWGYIRASLSLLFPLVPPFFPLSLFPWLGREIENTMARERMHEQRRALLLARVFNPGENTR